MTRATSFLAPAILEPPRSTGIEFGSTAQPGSFSGDFDLDSWSIEIDESKFAGATANAGTFNGNIIEDTNDTLPDFLSATIDESVSTRTSTRILVSPNTIWINDESVTDEANAFLRIQVTFADRRSTSPLTINPSPSGNMLVEAAARVGGRYQFEHSTDLEPFAPIDSEFTATAPFVTTFIRPEAPREFWRLGTIE